MTIARRLIILLALPLLALLGMGLFTRLELSKIEKSSRFVAEKQISSLAALGHITRSFYDLRAGVRSYLLATNRAEQVEIETAFNSGQAEVERLLNQYADSLVTGDQDRRFLSNYRDLSRDWIVGAKHAMSLGAQGRREDGVALLNGPVAQFAARLSQVSSEWIKHNEDLAAGAGRASVQTIASARLDMFLANSAVVLIAVVLGLLTFRRIVNPIQALERSVKAIVAGDYAKKVPFTSDRDE